MILDYWLVTEMVNQYQVDLVCHLAFTVEVYSLQYVNMYEYFELYLYIEWLIIELSHVERKYQCYLLVALNLYFTPFGPSSNPKLSLHY